MLLGVVALSGINFEVQCSEGLVATAVIGTVVAVRLVKSSATYKTYSEHLDRLAEEQEKSVNPLSHAQPLESSGLGQEITPVEEKIAAYEAQQKKSFEAYQSRRMEEEKPRATKKESFWNERQLIEQYEPKNQ